MDSPICLIENSENNGFRVNSEAMATLSKISQPVVVVSIVGMYRTGKSYLMNKLAGSQTGFDLGSTVQAKTKGIWMWCLPHPTKENHTLVLLDTEGLGDVDKGDGRNDMWIFCLAVLLSSVFVYNSKGVIDEDAIKKLRFVGEMSEYIKVKTKDDDDDEADFSQHFPIFIWAVRDFTLKLELNGEEITEDTYLENALMIQQTETKLRHIQERNNCRNCIRMYFKARKCFVFDFPTGDKEFLQRIEEVSEEQLSPTFIDQTKRFCQYVYDKAEVKCVDEIHEVTGKVLGELAMLYTEAIISSNVACMEDVVVNISEKVNEAAALEATQHYENRMKECVVFPTKTLDQFLELSRQCEDEALQIFLKSAFKDKDHNFQKKFMENIDEKKCNLLKLNEVESQKYCRELIAKHSGDLKKALQEGLYSTPGGYQKFKHHMKLIEEKYNSDPQKGIMAEEVLQEFQKSNETIGLTIMSNDKVLSEHQKKEEEDKIKREQEEMKKKMNKLKEQEEELKNRDKITTIQENFKLLVERLNAENNIRQEKLTSDIESKCKEQRLYMSQGCQEYANMYQLQINDMQKKKEEMTSPSWVSEIVPVFQTIALSFLPPLVSKSIQFLKTFFK